jgi:hypothetical protein
MTLSTYALRVTAMAGGSLALLWPVLHRMAEPGSPQAAAFGAILCALNTVGAYGLVSWAQGRSTSAFMGAVLGGMLGRMAAMLAAVAAGVVLLGLPQLPLVFSVLSYFTLFLVFELNVVNRTVRTQVAAR